MGEPTLPAGFEKLTRPSTTTRGSSRPQLGIEFVEFDAQRLVATMPVDGNLQPAGLLHGGASVALAETLGSIGAALHAGPDKLIVGVDINATHHRAAVSGRVTGIAQAAAPGPVHRDVRGRDHGRGRPPGVHVPDHLHDPANRAGADRAAGRSLRVAK